MPTRVNAALRLVGALDDPLRLFIVRHLMIGPATVSELIANSGAAQSKLSNHLALLRAAGIVSDQRLGRSVSYSLADPSIAAVVEAIEVAAALPPLQAACVADIAVARSCYDHIGGKLGVALLRALVEQGAMQPVEPRSNARKVRSSLGDVALGAHGAAVFARHGIDVAQLRAQRRRFATACNDWTESLPHLGGALGAALQQQMLRQGWLQRRGGTRSLRITPAGRVAFARHFGIDVASLALPAAST